ncbi:hypothetical protein RRG08_054588 [Elysia crispata]|uniref:Uncharacterized protein n=1 Tax=Elysia crispata TaxID=231223 RepID=A0AAE1B0I9_9GAST|nr:hypothetical protein RRG08_054588 [Elysia crispata]
MGAPESSNPKSPIPVTRHFTLLLLFALCHGNDNAKRLYDDLLGRNSGYNKLIRPVGNNTDKLIVKLGIRLSQLIDIAWAGNINILECPVARIPLLALLVLCSRKDEPIRSVPSQCSHRKGGKDNGSYREESLGKSLVEDQQKDISSLNPCLYGNETWFLYSCQIPFTCAASDDILASSGKTASQMQRSYQGQAYPACSPY